MLVNTENFGGVVRRLFSGSIGEIVSEVLQNCQRAGATVVKVTGSEQTIILSDNGSGLTQDAGSVDQFLPLVTLAMSSYDNPDVIDHQKPMGVGIFSILANEAVKSLTIASNNLSLTLRAEDSWNNEFWKTGKWKNGIASLSEQDPKGVTLTIEVEPQADSKLAKPFVKTFLSEAKSLAEGYEDYFSVVINGETVAVSPRDLSDVVIDTEYAGNRLQMNPYKYSSRAVVNWYGQEIKLDTLFPMDLFYTVRQGTPLTPMSPTRKGVVNDSKLSEFRSFVRDKVREFVSDPANRELVSVQVLNALYVHDREWFLETCPYFVAANPIARPFDESDLVGSSFNHFASVDFVCSYEEAQSRLTLDNVVAVHQGELVLHYDVGLDSFVQALPDNQPITLKRGHAERAGVQSLHWKPGTEATIYENSCFVGKGEIALETSPNADLVWFPVSDDQPVFVSQGSIGFGFDDGEMVIGADTPAEALQFLDDSWSVWSSDYSDDYSSDELSDCFKEYITSITEKIKPNTICDSVFDWYKLSANLDIKRTDLQSIEFTPEGFIARTVSGDEIARSFL